MSDTDFVKIYGEVLTNQGKLEARVSVLEHQIKELIDMVNYLDQFPKTPNREPIVQEQPKAGPTMREKIRSYLRDKNEDNQSIFGGKR